MPVTHIVVSGRRITATDYSAQHVVELTDTEVTDALGYVPASTDLFSTTEAGLVPTSPGGSTAYLRADGTWATPAGGGGGAWGGITGTLSDQTDLQSALNGKAATVHTHVISDVTGLQAALDAKADDSDLAGYATDGELAAGLATKANTSHSHVPGDILNVPTGTVFYRKTASTGAAETQTLATLKTDLGLTGTNSGDQTTITGNAGTATALQNSRNFSITGGGITAAAVSFNGTANVALNASVDAGHITLARMADLAASRFIGRVTASTGVPEAMTGTQATTLLDTFTTSLKGLAPASGGGSSNFLRADGTWAVPPTGSGLTWTTLKLASDFTAPNSTTFTNISDGSTTLTFTPPADTDWELEAKILIWTTTAANLPRVGLNCPTGAARGYGTAILWQAGATATTSVSANGGWNNSTGVTDIQMAAGGVLTASVPYLCEIAAAGRSGTTPTAITIQLACETAAANTCLAKRGSFMRYRSV